jgi:hypothetical protein
MSPIWGRELPFIFLVVWALEFLRTDRRLSANSGRSAHYPRLFGDHGKRTVTVATRPALPAPKESKRSTLAFDASTPSSPHEHWKDKKRGDRSLKAIWNMSIAGPTVEYTVAVCHHCARSIRLLWTMLFAVPLRSVTYGARE